MTTRKKPSSASTSGGASAPAGREHFLHGWVDPSGRAWQAEVEWGTIGGRAEPISVRIRSLRDEHPVTAAAVRAFPLAETIRSHRVGATAVLAAEAGDPAVSPTRRRDAKRRRDQFAARRGVALSPEGLEAVAEVYKAAYVRGDGVTKAVAEAFDIATSTAGKRIVMARRAGLLDGIGDVR